MTGEGIINVRLPRSLLETLRATADSQGLAIHQAARRLVGALASLSHDDLKGLKEPPWELDSLRISQRGLERLAWARAKKLI